METARAQLGGEQQRRPHAAAEVVIVDVAAAGVGEHQRFQCGGALGFERRLGLRVDRDDLLEALAVERA